MTAILVTLLAFASFATADSDRPPARVWLEVTASDIDAWRQYHGDRYQKDDSNLALQELGLTLALSFEAVKLGLDQHRSYQIEQRVQAGARALAALQKRSAQAVVLDQDELGRRLANLTARGGVPKRHRLRNLFKRFSVGAGSTDRLRQQQDILALRRRVLEGESFAQLASTYSDSQSRLRGGLIGNVRPGMLAPELESIAFSLSAGDVSEVIETDDGLTLLYCESVLPAVKRSEAENREIAERFVRAAQERQAKRLLREQLEEQAQIQWFWTSQGWPEDPNTKVVSIAGEALTAGDVAILSGRSVAGNSLTKSSTTGAVESYARGQMAQQTLRLLGAESDSGSPNRRRWERLESLAGLALASAVQERLKPITDTAMENHYNQNRQRFIVPPRYRVRLIQLPLNPDDPKKSYQQAAVISESIGPGGEGFLDAATKAGDLSALEQFTAPLWMDQQKLGVRFGIELLQAVLALENGGVSDFIEANNQLWIVHRTGYQPRRVQTFEEARVRVENELGQQQVRQLEHTITEQWLGRLSLSTD